MEAQLSKFNRSAMESHQARIILTFHYRPSNIENQARAFQDVHRSHSKKGTGWKIKSIRSSFSHVFSNTIALNQLISIRLGRSFSAFGRYSFRTPFSDLATTLSGSKAHPRVTFR